MDADRHIYMDGDVRPEDQERFERYRERVESEGTPEEKAELTRRLNDAHHAFLAREIIKQTKGER